MTIAFPALRPSPLRLLLFVTGAGMLTAAMRKALGPPASPPSYLESRPTATADGLVTHREAIVIDVPLARYLEWSRSVSLESILPAAGRIPRVVGTEPVFGLWDDVGARRRVILADGHYAAEEILENDRRTRFRYQVWGYTNPARLLIAYAIGEFAYTAEGGQTRLTWAYAFQPTMSVVRPLLVRFVDGIWADYMRRVLATMRVEAEQHPRTADFAP